MTIQTVWLRFADLKARGIVRNRVTLSRWIQNLDFPPGYMIGMNTRAWPEPEIEAWLAERMRASAETAAPEASLHLREDRPSSAETAAPEAALHLREDPP